MIPLKTVISLKTPKNIERAGNSEEIDGNELEQAKSDTLIHQDTSSRRLQKIVKKF